MSHTTVLQTCLTDSEKTAVIKLAEKSGISVSAYIRRLIKADITASK